MNITHCDLCPRMCGVDRTAGQRGYCGADDKIRIALVSLHKWEEPCLTGKKGAGTVFFSYCNMGCLFCQNYDISHDGKGIDVDTQRLAEIFMEQQARGAASLDLVTPTHYSLQIVEALEIAKARGFSLPVVYNCGGYERPGIIEQLRGHVDIFLPDLKYHDEIPAREYSAAPGYFKYASSSIEKMYDITGPCQFDSEGQMTRGVLVRHLILPGHSGDSCAILDYLHGMFGDGIYVSLMNQYTPMPAVSCVKNLKRRLTTYEYELVVDHALSLGMENCFVQDGSAAGEGLIPIFSGSNVLPKDADFPMNLR